MHFFIIFYRTYTKVWRYQDGNQKPYIEEGQALQQPKDNGQRDKTLHTKGVNYYQILFLLLLHHASWGMLVMNYD